MKLKYGTRRKVIEHDAVVDMGWSVCYNSNTALRFELSGHRGGFLIGATA